MTTRNRMRISTEIWNFCFKI